MALSKSVIAILYFVVSLGSYVSILTLVRVRMEQHGLYKATVTNEDDSKEVTFEVQVKGWCQKKYKHHIPKIKLE